MGFDRIRIKENAKTHYNLNKWNNVLVAFLFTAITQFVNDASSAASSVGDVLSEVSYDGLVAESNMSEEEAVVTLGAVFMTLIGLLAVTLICFILSFFVINIVTMGTAGWFQKSIYNEKLGVGVMFDSFRNGKYMSNVGAMALKQLLIILWSLLFIIPGYVKYYSYFLVEYIKMENPNISAKEAIDMSKRMMDGHKVDVFVLDLSFIGWNILSSLTCGILGLIYVNPYYMAAKAFAYEEIKADAIARGIVSEYAFVPDTVIV